MARQSRVVRSYSAWERSAAVVAGHFTNAPLAADCPALLRKSSLRPNLAPSLGDAGAGEPFALQRSFQLSPQLDSATRYARLYRTNTYLQHLRDFFIAKSFDVSQNHSFTI